MQLLIAVDEAGYGPKLGPLCIVATAYVCDDDATLPGAAEFHAFATPIDVDGIRVCVDDSKRVFKPASATKSSSTDPTASDPLAKLRRIIAVAENAMGKTYQSDHERWQAWMPDDIASVRVTPWLAELDSSACSIDADELDQVSIQRAASNWSLSPWRLMGTRARLVTASRCNKFFDESGQNKLDLLSQASLALAWDLLREQTITPLIANLKHIHFFFDRQGGRRYYASTIRDQWGDQTQSPPLADLAIIEENRSVSLYQLEAVGVPATVQFTVKGDSFTPVALSSLHAKWLRERSMQHFNDYFQGRFQELVPDEKPLRPTAGYPTDAQRFLRDIKPVLDQHSIDPDHLIRRR
ncbi:MAG: hypothetical protein AAF745_11990 [Planctomycetota bacterium]